MILRKLRKSLIVLIVNFFLRLPTLVIVYTIYSFNLCTLHTVLTVSEKDNTIMSCIILNSRSIKPVLLINVCFGIDDYTFYILHYFVMFYVFLSTFILFIFQYVTVCTCHAD